MNYLIFISLLLGVSSAFGEVTGPLDGPTVTGSFGGDRVGYVYTRRSESGDIYNQNMDKQTGYLPQRYFVGDNLFNTEIDQLRNSEIVGSSDRINCYIDKSGIGICSVDWRGGMTTLDFQENEIKTATLNVAGRDFHGDHPLSPDSLFCFEVETPSKKKNRCFSGLDKWKALPVELPEELKTAVAMKMQRNGYELCGIVDQNIKCWNAEKKREEGKTKYLFKPNSELNNKVSVAFSKLVGKYQVTDFSFYSRSTLKSNGYSAEFWAVCAIANIGGNVFQPFCASFHDKFGHEAISIPLNFTEGKLVSALNSYASGQWVCGKGSQSHYCWGGGSSDIVKGVETLMTVPSMDKLVISGFKKFNVCGLFNKKVRCWERIFTSPKKWAMVKRSVPVEVLSVEPINATQLALRSSNDGRYCLLYKKSGVPSAIEEVCWNNNRGSHGDKYETDVRSGSLLQRAFFGRQIRASLLSEAASISEIDFSSLELGEGYCFNNFNYISSIDFQMSYPIFGQSRLALREGVPHTVGEKVDGSEDLVDFMPIISLESAQQSLKSLQYKWYLDASEVTTDIYQTSEKVVVVSKYDWLSLGDVEERTCVYPKIMKEEN